MNDPADKNEDSYKPGVSALSGGENLIKLNMHYTYMPSYFLMENIAQTRARDLNGDCGVFALLYTDASYGISNLRNENEDHAPKGAWPFPYFSCSLR